MPILPRLPRSGLSARAAAAILVLLPALALPSSALAENPPGDASGGHAPVVEVTREMQGAIARGLAYLASRQRRAGSFRGAWDAGEYIIPVTALAGLALLASGSTPTSGPYSENVSLTVDFLLQNQTKYGLFVMPGGHDERSMYGHGFTTLFLAECYGLGAGTARDHKIRDALRGAVRVIGDAQSKEGGWYYKPGQQEDEGSVTVTQIQALRAARNVGIKVDRVVVDRALDYIRRSQDPDGGVRYTVHYGRSSLALTSAGLAVLFGAGDYDSDNVKRALSYVRAHMDMEVDSPHFHYTHFYAAQALYQQGGGDWEAYFPRIRAELLRQASDDKAHFCSWNSSYGDIYATALSLLILEVPYRYLPIFER